MIYQLSKLKPKDEDGLATEYEVERAAGFGISNIQLY